MKAYLSGPMTGMPSFNFGTFRSAAAWLRRAGWEVISPAEHDLDMYPDMEQWPGYATGDTGRCPEFSYHLAMGWDLSQIARPGNIDAIVLLPGWENSSGAAMELQVARWTGKRVFYLTMPEDRTDGSHWKLFEPNDPVVLGLCGYSQVGKDTVGQMLVEYHGFTRVSFADALRDMAYALNPSIPLQSPFRTVVRHQPLQELVDTVGWDRAKTEVPEVRALLQRLGTEAGRNVLGEDIWVTTALQNIRPGGRYVVTDCRFPNEAKAIRGLGGTLWRIKRPGYEPVNAHPSETALDALVVDTTLTNNGPIPQLRSLVHSLAGRLLDAGRVSV